MIPKEAVPELVVEDVERSIRFYRDLLGFQVAAQAPESGMPTWAELVNGPAHLMVQARNETLLEIPSLSSYTTGGTMLLVLRIESHDVVRDLWSKVKDRERVVLPLRETDYGTIEFGINDPDGYVLIFAGQ